MYSRQRFTLSAKSSGSLKFWEQLGYSNLMRIFSAIGISQAKDVITSTYKAGKLWK
jgi:hypothetical protein